MCPVGVVLLNTRIHNVRMTGACIFILCNMPPMVWGVVGLLTAHFYETRNERGDPVFHCGCKSCIIGFMRVPMDETAVQVKRCRMRRETSLNEKTPGPP